MDEKNSKNIGVMLDKSKDTSLMTLFREYSKTLDLKNDKYERIYKTSRDVTLRSKRVIFSLQRIPGLSKEEKDLLLIKASSDLHDIEHTLLKHIAMELRDEEPYQFIYAYTGGVQEYIEAVSLHHFLLTEQIISHSLVQKRVVYGDSNIKETELLPLYVLIPPKEYILGIADLTGELMRYCIKCVGTGDFEMTHKICDVLRRMNEGFLSLGYVPSKDLFHKIRVFRSSLHKVEDAQYSLQLRKSEVPADMLADIFAMYDADVEST